MNDKQKTWAWLPSLYFAEGLPYVMVVAVSLIMYKRMGVSNADIALYTSWLYLPWVIKPLWSPLVDLFKTKRWWIVMMQLFIGAALGGIALTIPVPDFFRWTLAFFWLLAFSSATHDIAADGFYMLGLNENQQAYFIGIRSTFYRIAMITGQGLLIIFAGYLERSTGMEPLTFTVSASEEHRVWQEPIFSPKSSEEELHFVVSAEHLKLSTGSIGSDEAALIKQWAQDWNVVQGFTVNEKVLEKQPSWWESKVSKPLKEYLQAVLGTLALQGEQAAVHGNMVGVLVKLNQPPPSGDELVLNLDRVSGSKDITLVSSKRLTFSSKNWDKGARVLFQLDPKQSGIVETVFSGVSGNVKFSWSVTFFVLVVFFLLAGWYHRLMLPRPSSDVLGTKRKHVLKEFWAIFVAFFKKKDIGLALLFMLTYRLGESQLVKLASPFLLDARELGGLGLTTSQVGVLYGTVGMLFLTFGGILGGWVASRKGLKFWIFWMTLAMNLPNLAYVFLAHTQVDNWWFVAGSIAIEQFGYGFGFTAFMLYMIYFSEGEHKTAHYAIGTGFMALGMMLPGMISGWIQEVIGYEHFFIWVMLCTLPGFFIIRFLRIDANFGIKKKE